MANKVLLTDGVNAVAVSTVTETEVDNLIGTSANIQTSLNAKEDSANKDNGTLSSSAITFPTSGASKTAIDAKISDTAYDATSWNGVTTIGPSKNAVRDQLELNIASIATKEVSANKDASNGYAGLTLLKVNFKNVANTFTSFLTNSNTAARTYTFQNRSDTIADLTDIATKENVFSPASTSTLFEDFIGSSVQAALDWRVTSSGAGAGITATVSGSEFVNLAQGTITADTGTTSTGRTALDLGANLGVGHTAISAKWRSYTSTLSDGTNTFQTLTGYGDTRAGAGIVQTNEVSFVYDDSISPNWVCRTTKAGVTTQTTTSTVVAAGAFRTLGIDINTAGTSVVFSVNGTTVATHTTNIPGFLNFVGPLYKINKTVGTTARSTVIDYFYQKLTWTGAR